MKHAVRSRKPAILIISLLMLFSLLLSACGTDESPVEPTEDRRGSAAETDEQASTDEEASADVVEGDGGSSDDDSESLDAESEVPLVPSINAGGVGESYEETWESYLRDSVAFQVRRMQDRVRFSERYQNPGQLEANAGGTMADVELVEDRSEFQLSNNDTFAQATVDFDIRVTYLDGDSVRFTCQYLVQIEKEAESGMWYVINPRILDVTTFCG